MSDRHESARYHAQVTVAESEIRRLARKLASIDPVWRASAYERVRLALLVEQDRLRRLREHGDDYPAL